MIALASSAWILWKTADGYEMKSVWQKRPERHVHPRFHRNRLHLRLCAGSEHRHVAVYHPSILKTGETVFTMDVSNKYGYNNMAIGMYAGNSGNALY